MPITKGSVTLSRFSVGSIPNEVIQDIPNRLKKFSFMSIDDVPEERAFGWTNFDDMLDTDWKSSTPEKDPYIAFSLRLDTRRIASATLAKERRIALDEEQKRIESLGKKFIPRDRKKEIGEQVKLRLLAKTVPTPAYFEVVWDIAKGIVYLGSASKKIQDMFFDLFSRTFETSPTLLAPYEFAVSLLSEEKLDDLNNIFPSDFSGAQNATDVSTELDHILSEEFLTWILYRAWNNPHGFNYPKFTTPVMVELPASVQHFNGASRSIASVRGDDLTFAEIFKGLQEGKKVCGLTLGLEISGASYSVRLSYPDLLLRGAKLPAVAKDDIGDNPDGLFLERTYLIETIYEALDALFKEFVFLRISQDWKEEEESIREWITNKK